MLNSNISPTCPHNMANFSTLAAQIGSLVWGTPVNFNGFRFLALLLQRHRSTGASQTLHDIWPSPGLVDYIFLLLPRNGILQGAKFTLHPSLELSYIGSITARHSSSGRQPKCGVQQRAPPLFDRPAITSGIGPHSSFLSIHSIESAQ